MKGLESLLGFNSLFFNQPLPCRALRPAFRILSATRRCSFSLEICWASKSTAQLIFSIENFFLKNKNKKTVAATVVRVAAAVTAVAARTAVAAAVLLKPTWFSDQDLGTLLSHTAFRGRGSNHLLAHTLPSP